MEDKDRMMRVEIAIKSVGCRQPKELHGVPCRGRAVRVIRAEKRSDFGIEACVEAG